MSATAQLVLNLEYRPALGREDFLVAASNAEAVAWIDRPDWPMGRLALYGPAGCGKSHLAAVWRSEVAAVEIGAAQVMTKPADRLLRGNPCVVLTGAAALADGAAEALLHFINYASERGCRLLMTDRQAPARWPCALPDLRSRLAATQAVALGPPDDALIAGLLLKLFADRQLDVAPGVVKYLVTHMERSFVAAQELVRRLDQAALSHRRKVTVPLAAMVLGEGAP